MWPAGVRGRELVHGACCVAEYLVSNDGVEGGGGDGEYEYDGCMGMGARQAGRQTQARAHPRAKKPPALGLPPTLPLVALWQRVDMGMGLLRWGHCAKALSLLSLGQANKDSRSHGFVCFHGLAWPETKNMGPRYPARRPRASKPTFF